MAEKQVRIDLVANDDASPVIDDVAAAAKDLEQVDPTVEIDAKDRASPTVDDLLQNVKALSDEDATIVLAIRAGQVQRELSGILEDLGRVDAEDVNVDVSTKEAQDARAELDKLETAIKEINDVKVAPKIDTSGVEHFSSETGKARDNVHSFAGNALSELPGVSTTFGPLGEAVGQMTEGLLAGEIAMGQLAAAAAPIAAITVAVKLVSDAIAQNKKRAEEARKATEDWRKELERVADSGGDSMDAIEARTRELIKTNDDLRDALEDLGLSGSDLARALDGDLSPALQDAVDFQQEFNDAMADERAARARAQTSTALEDLAEKYGTTTDALLDRAAAGEDVLGVLEKEGVAFSSAKDDLDQTTRLTKGLGDAHETMAGQVDTSTEAVKHSNEALDKMREKLDIKRHVRDLGGSLVEAMDKSKKKIGLTADEVDKLQDQVLTTAADFNRSPIEVQTALEALERGDYAAVWNMAQGWMNQKPLHQPVELDVRLNRSEIADFLSGQGLTLPVDVTPRGASSTSVVNVTQVFPRGFRPQSIIGEARAAARRNGGLYQMARR